MFAERIRYDPLQDARLPPAETAVPVNKPNRMPSADFQSLLLSSHSLIGVTRPCMDRADYTPSIISLGIPLKREANRPSLFTMRIGDRRREANRERLS